MKRFQEVLMKDIGWKLLSVAIAIAMWFMVINTTQTVDTRSYSRSITLENLDTLTNRGLTIGNEESLQNMKVSIKVKAQRTALDRLSQNPEWLQASVDFSGLTEVNNGDSTTLPVDIGIQKGLTDFDIVNRNPMTVEVQIETLTSRRMPIEITLNGELEDNTRLSEPTLSAETVVVTGPYSIMNQVASVSGTVNVADIQDGTELRVKLAAYDAANNPVKGVSISLSEVLVSYTLQDWKSVPIQVGITGTPAQGYQVGEVSCSPQYAELLGPTELLDNLLYLSLPAIDVSDATTPLAQSFSLAEHLPEGVTLRKSSTTTVTVLVDIQEQTGKTFTLDETNLSLNGQTDGLHYSFGSTTLTVSGDADALEGLTAEDCNATVYVSGLTEGTHTLLVHVDLPEGLSATPTYLDVTIGTDSAAPTEDIVEEE